jgi:hypothetical protein
MPLRTNRVTRSAVLAASFLAGTAFVVIPAPLSPAVAQEEDHSAHHPAAQAEDSAKASEHGGHGGMTGGGMQGGMHEGGMQGCGMMGGEHSGMMGGGHEGTQGGTHEGGVQGCGMMGGEHGGMKHGDKDAADGKPAAMKHGDMRKMMQEMMAEMASRVDERLAAVKSDLAITDTQLPQWTVFADAVRSAARSMEQTHKEMMAAEAAAPMPMSTPAPGQAAEPTPGGTKSYPGMEAVKKSAPPAPAPVKPAGSLPAKLEAHEKMLNRHLDSLKAIEAALDPLYATFDAKQKTIADSLKIGPMGVM